MYTSWGREGDWFVARGKFRSPYGGDSMYNMTPVYVLATDWLVYGRPVLLLDGYTVRVRGDHYHLFALAEVNDRKSLERDWLPWWALAERWRRYRVRRAIHRTTSREELKAIPLPPRRSNG